MRREGGFSNIPKETTAIPEPQGIAGDVYQSQMRLLRELLAKGNDSGGLELTDYLVNALENRVELFPKSKPNILPTLEALLPIRQKLANKLGPPEWAQRGLSLLPFPSEPKIFERQREMRDPHSGAMIKVAEPVRKTQKTFNNLLQQINALNGLVKSGREKMAAKHVEDILKSRMLSFRAPKPKTDEKENKPVSAADCYQRRLVHSLPEFKRALMDFLEQVKALAN